MVAAIFAVITIVLTIPETIFAQPANPPGCSINGLNYNVQKNLSIITNGTVVTYTCLNFQNSASNGVCDIKLGTNGFQFVCAAADGTSTGVSTTLIPGNTILPGNPTGYGPFNFTNQCTILVNPGVQFAQVKWAAPGTVLLDIPNPPGDPANIDKTLSVVIVNPCIHVTKQCNGGPFVYGSPISFVGTVTNCGDTVLTSVSVVDDQAGVLISGLTLQPGQATNFSANYFPEGNLCGPFTNHVTASGTASQLTIPAIVSDSASAVCTVVSSPCINVTKTCPASVPFGTTSYVIGGVVTNCGNVPLVGVMVVDDNGTPGNLADDVTINIGSIGIGGSVPYSATNTAPGSCGPVTDKVIATGAGQ
jgi:hypothetical protein